MNAPLTSELMARLQGGPMERIGSALGLSPAQTHQAVSTALPLLLGALGRNARQPDGAQSLFSALQRDHRGLDIGTVLGSAVGGGGQGGQIVGHLFGARAPVAANQVASVAGLDQGRADDLIRMLAPAVMAFVARRTFGDADGPEPTPDGLGRALADEEAHVRSRGGTAGGLLSLLDQDGDGGLGLGDLGGLVGGSGLSARTAEMRTPRHRL